MRLLCIGGSVIKLRCTSVTKLKYTPRHCFVTQYNKTVLGRRLPVVFGSLARPGAKKKKLELVKC